MCSSDLFSVFGVGISCMAFTLAGSTWIPLSLTMKPNNFPDLTPKVHLLGFNLSLYNLSRSNLGANLEPSVKQQLIQMLHDYVEVFSWSYEYIPGLDTDFVVHRLSTKEDFPPVKQKVHHMRPEMSEKIKVEVMK